MSPEDKLVFAASCGDIRRIVELYNSGVSVNSCFSTTGSTALSRAARHGRLDVCRVLVQLGAQVYDSLSRNASSLHSASGGGHEEIVSYLLSVGARVNSMKSENDETAGHVAARWGRRGVLEILWKNGADFRLKNIKGRNVVEEALHWGEDETADWARRKTES